MKKEFEKRAVLFLDIMGFRQIVNSCKIKSENIDKIYNVLSIIKTHFKDYPDILKVQFSDSIVISFRTDDRGAVIEFIGSLQSLSKKFILNSFLLRGGLVFGDIYHDNDFIFGHAMNKAYDLEYKSAIYPRIVIEKEIIEYGQEHLPDFFNENMGNCIFNYVSKDIDGNFFIDYFQKGVDAFWEIENNEKEYIQSLERLIKQGLLHECDNIYIKYLWMKDKYNHLISELKSNKQVSAGGFTLGSNKENLFYKNLETIEHVRY